MRSPLRVGVGRKAAWFLSAALALGAAGGCYLGGPLGSSTDGTGATGGGDGQDGSATGLGPDAPTSFKCDPTQKPPVGSLRLLTVAQYTNTLTDLTSWALGDPSGAATVLTEVASSLAGLPANLPVVPQLDATMAALFPDGGYLREDQDQQQLRVQAYYAVGVGMGASLTTPARLGTVVGTCATDGDSSNDAACLTSFIQGFGARALRRPLGADDLAFYASIYGSDPTADPAAYADVIGVLLQAPDFLYFVEHGDQPVAGMSGVFTLSAFELASRLSYQVWDTLPDEQLWNAAQDGSLLRDDVYATQVHRLFADPRAKAAIHRFFADYFQVDGTGGARGKGGLNYHDLAAYDSDAVFKAFAGADLPAASLDQSMVDDALAMVDYYTWTKPGTAADLLTSALSFAHSPGLAKIYGLPAWDGVSAPPSFAQDARPGLFTRALFVSSGVDTSPILKGVYLRRYVLCDEVGRPPAAAANATVMLSTHETTRQVVTDLTSVSPCNSCHPTWINPLGFATESFDGLGRARTAQKLFNADGSSAGSLPVDTSAIPRVSMLDDQTSTQNAADLMRVVAASGKFEACLTRNYFRYAFARFEDLQADGCTLEAMRSKLDRSEGPGLLADMLEQVVLTPAFKQRTFE
jgi:hypothetical protein